MDWIKINTTLPQNPRVVRLGSLMGISTREALGLIIEWLCWLDSATGDGSTGLTAAEVDNLFSPSAKRRQNVTLASAKCHARSVTASRTFSNALLEIGWAYEDENGVFCASNYDEHNGKNAKRRAQGAKRVAVARKRVCNANSVTPCNAPSVTREEKSIYKEIKNPNGSINTVCGGAAAQPDDSTRPSSRRQLPLPESADAVLAFLASQPNCGLRGDDLTACAESFFNDFEATGWTMRNQPVANWHAAARAFLARWQGNLAARAAAAPQGPRITYRSETQQNYEL